MKTLLIVGGCGFVGKNIIEVLSKRYRIAVCDRRLDKDFLALHPHVVSYQFSFPDKAALHQIIEEFNPAYVINLVSIVTAERDLGLFGELVRTNIEVLLELFECLRGRSGFELFMQFGSAEEYGPIEAPFSEDRRELPNSPYALIKQLTSNTALMLHRNYDFPAMVVRPGNIFGKYQPQEKLLPYLLARLKEGEPLDLSPGEQTRDFIYAVDLAEALDAALKSAPKVAGSIVNISSGEGVRIRDLVDYLKTKLDSPSRVNYGALPYRAGEMMDFRCDVSRIERLAGWKPPRDLFESLDHFLASNKEYA